MAPGARSNFGAPMSETEVFRKQMQPTALKQVLVTLLGLFGSPRSDSASGELRPPLPPVVTPLRGT